MAGLAVTLGALLAGPAASADAASVICPPPPCLGGTDIVCPLDSSGTAVVYCACPIAVTGAQIAVLDGCVDLAATVRVDRATAVVGDRLTYTIEVRNGGPDTATDVALVDPLPPGLALVSSTGPSLGALGPGEVATATVVGRGPPPGG